MVSEHVSSMSEVKRKLETLGETSFECPCFRTSLQMTCSWCQAEIEVDNMDVAVRGSDTSSDVLARMTRNLNGLGWRVIDEETIACPVCDRKREKDGS